VGQGSNASYAIPIIITIITLVIAAMNILPQKCKTSIRKSTIIVKIVLTATLMAESTITKILIVPMGNVSTNLFHLKVDSA